MLSDELWGLLEERLFGVPSTPTVFNQYKDVDPALELPDGAQIRRENYWNYLRGVSASPDVLLVGEAPGPWGCRFSGIPFTGEAQLCNSSLPFTGGQSSLSPRPYSERSGTMVWQMMLPHYPDFFLWNCVPLHTHKAGVPLSVRNPTTREIASFCSLLRSVHGVLAPRRVIAIGRSAERALREIEIPCSYVRHPSQGGAIQFREGMNQLLNGSG